MASFRGDCQSHNVCYSTPEQNAYCGRITLSRFVMEENRFGHRRVTCGRRVGSTGFCCTSSRHNFGIKSRYFVMRSCYSSGRCDASLDKWAVTNMRHIHSALYQGQHLLSRPGLKRLIATSSHEQNPSRHL